MLATKFSQWIEVSATNGNHLYTFYEKASDLFHVFSLHRYPCGLKFCHGKDAKGGAVSYRCGIKTCKKCRIFDYFVKQKMECLWDQPEWKYNFATFFPLRLLIGPFIGKGRSSINVNSEMVSLLLRIEVCSNTRNYLKLLIIIVMKIDCYAYF